LLDIIVLKAKPNRNEVAISVIVNGILFIVCKINFFLFLQARQPQYCKAGVGGSLFLPVVIIFENFSK
jgi:hypothetical protein